MKPELIEIVKRIRYQYKVADEYLESVPRDLSDSVMENGYVTNIAMIGDIAMQGLFGDMYEDISWFFYEFKPKADPQIWLADGTAITLQCDEDYYEYLRVYG